MSPPALCTDGHLTTAPRAVPAGQGYTCHSEGTDLPLVQHSPSRFSCPLAAPAALLSSFSILHRHTDGKPQEESPLFIFPLSQQVPEAAHLTKSYLYHVIKALFLPLAPHAACGQPSASMSGVKFAFPFSLTCTDAG